MAESHFQQQRTSLCLCKWCWFLLQDNFQTEQSRILSRIMLHDHDWTLSKIYIPQKCWSCRFFYITLLCFLSRGRKPGSGRKNGGAGSKGKDKKLSGTESEQEVGVFVLHTQNLRHLQLVLMKIDYHDFTKTDQINQISSVLSCRQGKFICAPFIQ